MAVLLLYEAPDRARGVVSLAHPKNCHPLVVAPTDGMTVCAAEVVVVLDLEVVLEFVLDSEVVVGLDEIVAVVGFASVLVALMEA